MRLIIDVPDELVRAAFELAIAEAKDYQRRYDKPGWGWTLHADGKSFWVRGIKGGLSVSLSKPRPVPERSEPTDGATERHDGQLREAVKDCLHSSVNTGKEG